MSKTKRNSLLLLLIVGILILILSMGLSNLTRSPGENSLRELQSTAPNSPLPGEYFAMGVLRGVLAIALLVLPFYCIYSLQTAQGRERVIVQIILIAVLVVTTHYLQNQPFSRDVQQTIPEQAPDEPEDEQISPDITEFTPASVPSWLTTMLIVAVLISAIALIYMLMVVYQQRAKTPEFPYERLAQEAENAMESLYRGGNFREAIIQCYQEMSRVAKEEKGVAREITMTAREFEDRLVGKGLPSEAIHTLTQLFEQVRYGSLQTGAHERNLAFSCLTEIVNTCKVIGDEYEGKNQSSFGRSDI